MRDRYGEPTIDHHPTLGWFRLDRHGLMRALAVATAASRMHADPLVCAPMLLRCTRCSPYLGPLCRLCKGPPIWSPYNPYLT